VGYNNSSKNGNYVISISLSVEAAAGAKTSAKDIIMDFLKDLWGFLQVRKKFWLLPIILFLLFFGVLIVLTGGSAIAPFIYAIF
jgi:hypothetical protein